MTSSTSSSSRATTAWSARSAAGASAGSASRQTQAERRFTKLAGAINQKAARLGALGRITAVDLAEVFLGDRGRCRYCGIEVTPAGVSFDHVVPFAKGGSNTASNLAASCITCQRGKFTKSPEEWQKAKTLTIVCPVDGTVFKPRWADYVRGYGRVCSRKCAGALGGAAERTI